MFHLSDIRKRTDGLAIEQQLLVEDLLKEREPEVLALSPVEVKGQVIYDRDLYLLQYEMAYTVTLPSSRSLEPVAIRQDQEVNEVFIEAVNVSAHKELVEEDLILILEEAVIDLAESVVDNILLNLPSRVLSEAEKSEEALPSGKDWAVLTESQYQSQQAKEKEANSPFAGLQGLFED